MNKTDNLFGCGATYLGIRAIAAQTCILSDVRAHYLWFEEQFVHLLGRHAKEVLNSLQSFQVEFPHAKGPTFARLDSTN